MKIFSRLRKRLKNYIFTDEFDEKYQNTATKLAFILFCCSGGFCFHKDVRSGFKKFWITFNILNFILVNGSCLFFYLNAPITDYYTLLVPIPIMSGLFAKCGIYVWIFLTSDFFSKIFDFLDDKGNQSVKPIPSPEERKKYVSFCTVYSSKTEIQIMIASFCIILFGSVVHSFEKFVNYKDYFVILYPMYIAGEKTPTLRIIIQFVQNVTILPELIIFVTMPSLISVIATNVYNRFEFLSLFLRETSYSIFLRIDEIYNQEMAMDDGRIPSSLTKISELKIKKALALDEFETKMILVIRQHQQLYSIAKLYTKNIRYLFLLINAGTFFGAVVCGFFISSITATKSFHLIMLMLIARTLQIVCLWMLFCFIGERFHTLNELVTEEVYSSPWYHLEPKDRRLILTFLSILQRPISITAGRVFPVNLSSFPDTVNNIYSHVQILRTLQLNKHKR